jgi:hypothetical protein
MNLDTYFPRSKTTILSYSSDERFLFEVVYSYKQVYTIEVIQGRSPRQREIWSPSTQKKGSDTTYLFLDKIVLDHLDFNMGLKRLQEEGWRGKKNLKSYFRLALDQIQMFLKTKYPKMSFDIDLNPGDSLPYKDYQTLNYPLLAQQIHDKIPETLRDKPWFLSQTEQETTKLRISRDRFGRNGIVLEKTYNENQINWNLENRTYLFKENFECAQISNS